MRNALICAGVMLAMLLFWPVVFRGTGSAEAAQPARSPSSVAMVVPAATPLAGRAGLVRASVPPPHPGALETCSHHYARVAPLCTGEGCRQRTVDALDICEGTGFWPDDAQG